MLVVICLDSFVLVVVFVAFGYSYILNLISLFVAFGLVCFVLLNLSFGGLGLL